MNKYSQNSKSVQQNGLKFPSDNVNQVDQLINHRRNTLKTLVAEQERKAHQMRVYNEAYTDTVIEFTLFFQHTNSKAQELDGILNFYKIGYKRNMNPLFINNIKQQYPKLKEINQIPFLRVHVSLDPVKFVVGNEQIIRFLVENGFIFRPKHMTFSAYAQQGVQFAEEIGKNLDILFYSPVLTIENNFKSHPESYKEGGKNYILVSALRYLITDCTVKCFRNIQNIYKNKEEFQNSREKFLKHMEMWKEMLQDNEYHGGEHPDEADFAVYGELMAKYNSKSFQRFVENKVNGPAYRWFLRMRQNCRYEPDRILFDEEDDLS